MSARKNQGQAQSAADADSAVTANGVPSNALARRLAAVAAGCEIPFRVIFADGAAIESRGASPAFTVTFRSRGAELRTLAFGYVGLLESYIAGSIEIDGDIALVFRAGFDSGYDRLPNPLLGLRNRWHEWRFSNRSIEQAKANARYHYGLGEAFYRHWLDTVGMLYTCAYWSEGTTTLEQAQKNKMDHVCRKVQLKAGESFVDVGCGWGGLLFHAWDNYGALGTGINTTTEQITELRAELARRGLADKIALVECDFRQIPGQYDKLLSIGTLEHAGRDGLPAVIRAHAGALKPGGLGVIHFIGHVGTRDTELFIRKHIFPGGWIPSLAQAITWMERCGLEVLDIENLRRHYALTLDCWGERFDRNWAEIHALDPRRFDEPFRRKWRAYLWSCAEVFRSKTLELNLFQVTVSKGSAGTGYPLSRKFLYGS
jgi:cyclopropane-fatty-acyl-phospholipid synthase